MISSVRPDYLDLSSLHLQPKDHKQNQTVLAKFFESRTPEANALIKIVNLRRTFLAPDDLAYISQQCPNIEVIDLKRAHRIDDAALKIIGQCFGKNLRELDLGFARNDADLHMLVGRSHWEVPTHHVGNIKSFTDEGIKELLQQTPKLTKLSLRNSKISEEIIPAIVKSPIQDLNIKKCLLLGFAKKEKQHAIDQFLGQRPWMIIKDDKGTYNNRLTGTWKWIKFHTQLVFAKIQAIVQRLIDCIKFFMLHLTALTHRLPFRRN